MQQLEEDPVGPSEADYIRAIAGGNVGLRGSVDHVVLLADGSVPLEILLHHGQELLGKPVGILIEPVPP